MSPTATIDPSRMIPTRSLSRSTSSSWWEENITGHAGCGLVAQDSAHDVDGHRVEAGERLVEHEDLRVVDERRGELDALLVAQAQLDDLVVAPVGDAEHLGPALHRAARRPRSMPCSRAR